MPHDAFQPGLVHEAVAGDGGRAVESGQPDALVARDDATLPFLVQDRQTPAVFFLQAREHLPGFIGAAVVDADHFQLVPGPVLVEAAFDDARDVVRLVFGGDAE